MGWVIQALCWALDWQADWLRRAFTPRQQMRSGVAMIDISFLYLGWWKWSGEPVGIFTMSAWAMLFSGITAVIAAEIAERNDKGKGETGSG